jgi:hypothetical protein
MSDTSKQTTDPTEGDDTSNLEPAVPEDGSEKTQGDELQKLVDD